MGRPSVSLHFRDGRYAGMIARTRSGKLKRAVLVNTARGVSFITTPFHRALEKSVFGRRARVFDAEPRTLASEFIANIVVTHTSPGPSERCAEVLGFSRRTEEASRREPLLTTRVVPGSAFQVPCSTFGPGFPFATRTRNGPLPEVCAQLDYPRIGRRGDFAKPPAKVRPAHSIRLVQYLKNSLETETAASGSAVLKIADRALCCGPMTVDRTRSDAVGGWNEALRLQESFNRLLTARRSERRSSGRTAPSVPTQSGSPDRRTGVEARLPLLIPFTCPSPMMDDDPDTPLPNRRLRAYGRS